MKVTVSKHRYAVSRRNPINLPEFDDSGVIVVIPVNPLSVWFADESFDARRKPWMQPFPNLGVLDNFETLGLTEQFYAPAQVAQMLYHGWQYVDQGGKYSGLSALQFIGARKPVSSKGKHTLFALWAVGDRGLTEDGRNILPVETRSKSDVAELARGLLSAPAERLRAVAKTFTSVKPTSVADLIQLFEGKNVDSEIAVRMGSISLPVNVDVDLYLAKLSLLSRIKIQIWLPQVEEEDTGRSIRSTKKTAEAQQAMFAYAGNADTKSLGVIQRHWPAGFAPVSWEVRATLPRESWLGDPGLYRRLAGVRRQLEAELREIADDGRITAEEYEQRFQELDEIVSQATVRSLGDKEDLREWNKSVRELTKFDKHKVGLPVACIKAACTTLYQPVGITEEGSVEDFSYAPTNMSTDLQLVQNIAVNKSLESCLALGWTPPESEEEQKVSIKPTLVVSAIVHLGRLKAMLYDSDYRPKEKQESEYAREADTLLKAVKAGFVLDDEHRLILLSPNRENLQPSSIGKFDALRVAEFLGRVIPVSVAGSWEFKPVSAETPVLTSRKFIERSEQYKRAEAAQEGRKKKRDPYYSVIQFAVGSMLGTPEVVKAGRLAVVAYGGAGTAVKKIGKGSYQKRDKDYQATASPMAFNNLLTFAQRLIRELSAYLQPVAMRRTEIIDSETVGLLAQFDIDYPKKSDGSVDLTTPEARQQVVRALEELKYKASKFSAAHESSKGRLFDAVYPEDGDDEVAAFREELLSRTNPSRFGRRPRKPRGYYTGRVRQNPLDQTAVARAVAAARGERLTEEERTGLRADLDKLGENAASWTIDPNAVNELFLRRGKASDFSVDKRLQVLRDRDLVSRYEAQRDGELDQALVDVREPWKSSTGSLLKQAELSLKETSDILKYQKRGRLDDSTMQAATALCRINRAKKLTAYTPPPGFFQTGGDKKVVVWLSPIGSPMRVMTFRRNVHIDCDMVPTKTLGAGEIVGRAILSAVLWLAEKPGRMKDTSVYIGRVGEPGLYRIWSPSTPLSLVEIGKAMKEAQVEIVGDWKDDKRNYLRATSGELPYVEKGTSKQRPAPAADEELPPEASASPSPIESVAAAMSGGSRFGSFDLDDDDTGLE